MYGAAFSTHPLWKTALWRVLEQTTLFSLNPLQIQIGVLKEFTPLDWNVVCYLTL